MKIGVYEVMAGTALSIAALHGGIAVNDGEHGWRVDGDLVPAIYDTEDIRTSVSSEVELQEQDAYVEPAEDVDEGVEQTCIIPAVEVTTIERTTQYNDWTLPYGTPLFAGGLLLALAADNKRRTGVVFTPETRRALTYTGVLTGSLAVGGAVMYGILLHQTPASYRTPTTTTTVPELSADADTDSTNTTIVDSAPVYSYPSYDNDPCDGVDREEVRVTSEKTVTYKDGRLVED